MINVLPRGAVVEKRELLLLAACVLAIALFAIASPFFATADNAVTILRNSVELLLISLGMSLLLAMGGVDVSIGTVMGLAAFVIGRLLTAAVDPSLAALAGILAGTALGMVTGAVVVFGRIPAIVATLGLLGVYKAAIYLALGGAWLSGLPPTLTEMLQVRIVGVPIAVIVIALSYGVIWLAMRRTPFGLHLLAVGNSEEKARLQGVNTKLIQFSTFVISGTLAGVAAVFYIGTYRNVEMTIGSTLALDAIAAVVLGGTSILGGKCSLLGTVLGVLLLRILQNGLLLVGVPSLWQAVVTGALLIGVLSIEGLSGRLQLKFAGATQ
ncbi:AI-2 transport system permease protein [Kaistia soli DSM 19436]|uniref:Autoinducer 2 import system permease protein LsrC n=1 Tax=Kaistia soli DSM 19436 TaxID=1122133 RepID=A0A1M5I4Q6_9HYPH|nr:ABC transporter permease [Kaistia soli]SHG23231.1 AI-2 transport system permease protein [Kaistia soli DSM 19436]